VPLFAWEARTSDDEARTGELAGASEVQIIEALRRQGLRPTRVVLRTLRADSRPAVGIAPVRLSAALRALMALRTAGVGPAEALDLAASRTTGELARTLRAAQLAVESGVGLGEALARHPATFGALGARVLASADARGTLEPALAGLVALLERSADVRARLKQHAARPLLAAAVALGALALLSAAVVPTVLAALVRAGAPAWPRMQTVCSAMAFGTSIAAALLALAAAALAVLTWRRPRALALPAGLGDAARRLALARFARALALLLAAEVPRLAALELAAWEADDRRLTVAALRARVGLSQGGDLGGALAEAALPPEFAAAVRAAGRGGDLPATLRQLAELDEDEALAWLSVRSWRIAQVLYAMSAAALVAAALAVHAAAAPLLRT
jgi:type IV pilus assembly protein PilC